MKHQQSNKVLLIGWDAAEWKIINKLIGENKLPTLKKFIEDGCSGKIATLEPVLSPMLWTSIATGKTADKHGVLNFVETDHQNNRIRPITINSRKCKAIWNILNQNGYRSNIFGWWPSYPAEPINGIVVTEYFGVAQDSIDKPWTVHDNEIHPPDYKSKIAGMRIHPQELTLAHIEPFIPEIRNVSDEESDKIEFLMRNLAHDSSIHAAATWALENTTWDFTAVYYNGMDSICHYFMKYMPPQQNGISDTMFSLYKNVVQGIYMFYDMMLERLLDLVPDDAHVILVSDHGFHVNENRVARLPKEPSAPAHEHSNYGMVGIKGPGIKKHDLIYGATLLDITPTLLSLFDLPIGKDMDGKIMADVFEETPKISYIESWENVSGNTGRHEILTEKDVSMNKTIIKQLELLGYVENSEPETEIETKIDKTQKESNYNLAQVYMHKNKFDKAIAILEELNKEYQNRYMHKLFQCYETLRLKDKMYKLINTVKKEEPKQIHLINYLYGKYYLRFNDTDKALEHFLSIKKEKANIRKINFQLGKTYFMSKDYQKALECFDLELTSDTDNALIHYFKGLCNYYLSQHAEAIEDYLQTIGLQYHFPKAHYYLGISLYHQKHYSESANAFEVSLLQGIQDSRVFDWLERIYKDHIYDPDRLKILMEMRSAKKEITIVSGLPRTGTSMMMQILEKGGLQTVTDQIRKPDPNNPNGYYEYEMAKNLPKTQAWLNECVNKCVKIVSPLLFYLPPSYQYKVIVMERDTDEVVLSQKRMLERNGIKIREDNYPFELVESFRINKERVSEWIASNKNVKALYIQYKDVLENPDITLKNIADFLGVPLNIVKMKEAVDPALYRERC